MTGECDGASGPLGKLCKSAGGGGGGGERDLIGSDFSFIHEQGRGPGRKSANNEKKSPTNIYIFFLFSNPRLDLVFWGENLNCPLKWTEQRPGLGGGSRMGGATLSKCLLLTNASVRAARSPLVAHGPLSGRAAWECLPSAGGFWILSFALASQGSESVEFHVFSLLSLITLKFPRVGPTGSWPRVTSWERFMTFSEICLSSGVRFLPGSPQL